MDAKRPPLPLVLTANDLLEGWSIYFGPGGWTKDIKAALVGADDESAARLDAEGRASIVSGEVVDPYLTTVAVDADGAAMPVHYRERIRVTGPTIAFGTQGGRNSDVPL